MVYACYMVFNNSPTTLKQTVWLPCGEANASVLSCCVKGDYCLSESVCHYTHSMTGGSGFYGSGCTDPNFGYPCTLKCGDQTKPDIVFNATSGLWNCCGADSQKIVHCQSPIDETVDAPAPSLLTTLGLIGGEGLFTPASTSMPTPSSSIIGSIQTSTTSTSRLQLASSTISGTVQSSRTLAVGILGIAIDALIGVALLFFAILLVLRRKRAPCFEGTSDDGGDILQTSNYDNELQGTPVSELQLRSSIRLPELNG